ncbi:unnamed protein product [Ixodes hexagonus]
MFVSLSGGYIADLHQEVDLLPPSVRIVILHIGTNDLASLDPQPVLQRYLDLLQHIQTRPGIQLVVCGHVLPRGINRRLQFPNRRFMDGFNHRAAIFNRHLTNICIFAGVDAMGRNLRALIPYLLGRIPRLHGTPAPDVHWPTLAEAAQMGRMEARHRPASGIRPRRNQRPN